MPAQIERLVLGENEDPADAGIDAIGKRKIDNPVGSAEWNGGFGRIAGQRMKAFTDAPSQQNCQNIIHSVDLGPSRTS